MARFPKREAEIATLAAEIINGLTENAEDFASSPITVEELQAKLGAALLHGSELRTDPPSPEWGSRQSVAVGHPEAGHRVEDSARDSHLHPLAHQSATPHTSADDRLVSIDRILDHAALAVARPLVPFASTKSANGADVPIPFFQCGRRS